MEKIRIILAGPRGKMGMEALNLIYQTEHFELQAAIDRKNGGKLISSIEGLPPIDAPIYEDAEQCFKEIDADVLLDLTTPEVGRIHTELALKYNIRPVVGTTGFNEQELKELAKEAEEKGIGVIIAPNFAIGAVLMMKFAQMAAKYFPDVEIIEQHHDQKLDAPSGTAIKTAELISRVRQEKQQGHPNEKETLQGARGAIFNGMRIHSVRLPGLVAHQEVLFGGNGQILTIRHDSLHRSSFMSGVKLAIEKVMNLNVLVYGLENIIE
ncbi:4-hydroxy-tetrahydrodipicolinate reductase [Calidifontibacillus erzurumensis]|uniref:4-hydroxy-tetrahydrodipicolinate reductase n=1 Tax=Calidifontibacillus erzurumensis TaxID=2741433 RepID=A0A8J8GFB1_9BACI|nr:4-hydroxy-tetrahydrodipicolinate reductase [Calidifontibacillus erzurumensis]NSL52272.1 4-hydroxy-tetrahydrodipicolinate reductase [Calidifontibacillus erzurumensis]